jgi:hypothetical protein
LANQSKKHWIRRVKTSSTVEIGFKVTEENFEEAIEKWIRLWKIIKLLIEVSTKRRSKECTHIAYEGSSLIQSVVVSKVYKDSQYVSLLVLGKLKDSKLDSIVYVTKYICDSGNWVKFDNIGNKCLELVYDRVLAMFFKEPD